MEEGNLQILVIKLELDDAVKEEAISGFLGLSGFKLSRLNVGQEKAYAKTYQEFMETIRLPEAYIECMCNAKYTRHFYTDAEIEDIRSKWLRRD